MNNQAKLSVWKNSKHSGSDLSSFNTTEILPQWKSPLNTADFQKGSRVQLSVYIFFKMSFTINSESQ